MTGMTLDPTRRHLVPVAPLALAHEPDDVHLAVCEWNARLDAWVTGWAICGRSSTQGRLPAGTTVTCTECLALQAGHERALARGAADCAAHGVNVAFDAGFCPDPCGTMHKRCTTCGEPLDGCTWKRGAGCGPECAEQHTYALGCEIAPAPSDDAPVPSPERRCQHLPVHRAHPWVRGLQPWWCPGGEPPREEGGPTGGSSGYSPARLLDGDAADEAPEERGTCSACGEPATRTGGAWSHNLRNGCGEDEPVVAEFVPAPAPPARRCAARLDRDGEHWACDRPTGHPGGHSAGEPWEAGYNAWTDRAAGASPDHAEPADTTAESEGGGNLVCVCGDPVEWMEHDTDAGWIHAPGSDTTCVHARPRCPNCGLPHLLTPGMTHVCASIHADVARTAPAPPASALRDQIAQALRDRIRRAAVPGMRPASGGAIGNPMGATEYDLADAALATPELAQLLAHLADYENRITWETNCGEHARLLDSCYAETVRAEKAEAEAKRLRDERAAWRSIAGAEETESELRRVSALHADTERRLKADLSDEVRKREAAEATTRTLGALHESAEGAVSRVHEYVQDLDRMAESTTSPHDRRLYRALAGDLRKRLGYDTNTPEETP